MYAASSCLSDILLIFESQLHAPLFFNQSLIVKVFTKQTTREPNTCRPAYTIHIQHYLHTLFLFDINNDENCNDNNHYKEMNSGK